MYVILRLTAFSGRWAGCRLWTGCWIWTLSCRRSRRGLRIISTLIDLIDLENVMLGQRVTLGQGQCRAIGLGDNILAIFTARSNGVVHNRSKVIGTSLINPSIIIHNSLVHIIRTLCKVAIQDVKNDKLSNRIKFSARINLSASKSKSKGHLSFHSSNIALAKV